MAVSSADHALAWPLTCVHAAWRTQAGWMAALVGLVFAWTLSWIAGSYFEQSQPVQTQIRSVTVTEVPPGSIERSLRIEIVSPPATNCTRMSQQLLYRFDNGSHTFYPLGSALNGSGFNSSMKIGQALSFVLILSVPSGTPAGEYMFIHRSVYTCTYLGGFLERRITYEAPPVPVHMGG
jgi:hypothetical protein